MKLLRLVMIAASCVLPCASPARAGVGERLEYRAVNFMISGKLLDYTDKHGADRRIWSEALGMKRNVYVYLPPNFDPARRYPLILLLHGFAQDESALFYILPKLDREMEAGRFPQSILVAPDGNIPCGPWAIKRGSFYVNSNAGRYEDYLLQDVLGFAERNFPIHPDRRARALVGVSMGGGAAFDLAMRHKHQFGVALGIFPPLNFRYLDCNESYRGKYDPNCFMLRTRADNEDEVLASFFGGLAKIRMGAMARPLFGTGDAVVEGLSRFNPMKIWNVTTFGPERSQCSSVTADATNTTSTRKSRVSSTKQTNAGFMSPHATCRWADMID
ncbi:MAG: alpha/beta hydrolase-fold protein [Gemmataceae bacterium]